MQYLSVENGRFRPIDLVQEFSICRLKMADLGLSIWCENATFGDHLLRSEMAHSGPSIWCKMQHLATACYG